MPVFHTVAEMPEYVAWVSAFGPEVRDAIIDIVGYDPSGGAIVRGTGGIRKRRVAIPGRGKSGYAYPVRT